MINNSGFRLLTVPCTYIQTFAVLNTRAADRCGCLRIGTPFTVVLQWFVLIVASLAVSATLSGAVAEVFTRCAVSCSVRITIRTFRLSPYVCQL